MSLVQRFSARVQKHGFLFTFHLVVKYLFGVNLINLYNAVIFREHKIATSCDISVKLPKSTILPHPIGIIIGHDVKLGERVRIQQNVTIGRKKPTPSAGYPTIGNDVTIGSGAVVLGDIELGEGCVVGANSVVLDDVEPNTTVVGIPANS